MIQVDKEALVGFGALVFSCIPTGVFLLAKPALSPKGFGICLLGGLQLVLWIFVFVFVYHLWKN